MAIKLYSDGKKDIVDIKEKIGKEYFPKSWYPVKYIFDKSTAYVFNGVAKYVGNTTNKQITERIGANVYGVVYVVHPEMISSRIHKVSPEDICKIDEDRSYICVINGIKSPKWAKQTKPQAKVTPKQVPIVKAVQSPIEKDLAQPIQQEQPKVKTEDANIEENMKPIPTQQEIDPEIEETVQNVEVKSMPVVKKITGANTIQLIRQIQNCPAEALDIILNYCQFPLAELDVRMFIAMEKELRMNQG